MDINSFGDLSNHVLECFQAEEYQQAYRVVTRHGDRFPEERWHIDYWRMILSVLVGKGKRANVILREALEGGMWWPERYLEQEEFEPHLDRSLVERCYQHRDRERATSKPHLLLERAEHSKSLDPLLFVIHRNHSNAVRERTAWLPALKLGWNLALPQSSQLVGHAVHVWDDRGRALDELETHLTSVSKLGGGRPSKLVFAGNVTGGNLAVRLALQEGSSAAGFITLSPYVPDLEETFEPLIRAASLPHLRGVITIGERDSRCYHGAVTLAALLREAGAKIDLRQYSGFTQGYPPDFNSLLPQALDFNTNQL